MSAAAVPATQRPRWRFATWVYICITLAFLVLYVVADRAQSRVARLPDTLELDAGDFPAHYHTHRVGSEEELEERIAGEPIGSLIVLRGPDDHVCATFVTKPAYNTFHKQVVRLNGLLFLAVSLIVFAPRIDKVPAHDLFWASTLYGLAVTIGGLYVPHGSSWLGVLLPLLRIVSLVILPILLLHVGLTFPHRAAILDRSRHLLPIITVMGLGLAAWYGFVWVRWATESSPGDWAAVAPARTASGVFLAGIFGAGCLGLVRGSLVADREREREQAKWLLWGIGVGSAPFIFLHGLPLALGRSPILPVEIARIFSIIIPIAFSFAVIRHRFLDVDIIIRRSLLYVVLASLLVGVYALLGVFIGSRIATRWPETGPYVPIVATVIATVLFAPTRRAIGALIDRVFFKIRYNRAKALASLRVNLAKSTNHAAMARRLERLLRRHLVPTSIGVELWHGEERFQAGDALPVDGTFPEGVTTIAAKGTVSESELESDEFPSAWRRAGYVVARKVRHENAVNGIVLLGPKQTGRTYVRDDLELLSSATDEAGRRIRRINLEQDFLNEVVARHRMEEMNEFRTQFFAQFAHDLRSPLTSINWGARNLLDGIVGEFNEAQRGYLQGIETSARQLVRLVNNLLEVTRFESGMPDIEFGPVQAMDVIEDSVSKLRATAAAKQVTIETHVAELPPVWSHPEKLLEVTDNLVENAIRYSPPGETIEIHARSRGSEVEIRVQDRGPGLEPEDIETIFEPYRQSNPSPHSSQQGFGLGLFVVRSWIERMGGSVTARNRTGRGACFRVRVPIAQEFMQLQSGEAS